ncbi:MAG: MOSC domain-containing protein [Elusimicrobia bacterium]|nr:MOSC domain-containing protein [Elusimicrobiota bacterium]
MELNLTNAPIATSPHVTPGEIIAVCTSHKKGIRKQNINSARFIEGHGIEADAHAGTWHRQVSLLAWESIEKMRAKGLNVNVGSFAENITTRGIDLVSLPIGRRLKIGGTVLEVTQIGKECHTKCAIYRLAGDCVMPNEGIFAKVIKGGAVYTGMPIEELGA